MKPILENPHQIKRNYKKKKISHSSQPKCPSPCKNRRNGKQMHSLQETAGYIRDEQKKENTIINNVYSFICRQRIQSMNKNIIINQEMNSQNNNQKNNKYRSFQEEYFLEKIYFTNVFS